MRKMVSVLLLLTGLMGFVSCGAAPETPATTPAAASSAAMAGSSAVASSLPATSQPPEEIQHWSLEPFLEADNVDLVDFDAFGWSKQATDALYEDQYRQVMLATQAGETGLINYEGEWVVQPGVQAFAFAETQTGEYGLAVFPGEDTFGVGQLLDETLTPTGQEAMQERFPAYYGWSPEQNAVYTGRGDAFSYGICAENMAEPFTEASLVPVIAYPYYETLAGQQAAIEQTGADNWHAAMREENYLKSGYATAAQLVAPCAYDAVQYTWENIGAAKTSEGWFYISADGTTLNAQPYSGVAALEYSQYHTAADTGYEYDAVYNFTQGLVAVCRDGLWGYMDATGAEVIPCQYEATRPVFEGKAWVKTSGLWGVADLSAYVS